MTRLLTTLACLALAPAVLAGCGSDNSNDSSSTPSDTASKGSTATEKTAAAPTSAAGGTVAVSMKNIQFNPKSINAKVGQTVKWTNDDTAPHNVTATKGEEFKSKTFNKGQSYSYKLDKPGTITYVCTIHPGMEGTITVTK
jgi:plastocyanin